ncbi:MAG TPA: hypothetical protein VFI31_05615 [Pirellulales bacterium]|nr:hypothetical protein [Pirellulales bacterium]
MSRPISSRNAALFVSVLLLGVAVRLYGAIVYASDANFDFRDPQDIAAAKTWATILIMALAGSLIGAAVGYRWNRTTAALMGPVGAAVAAAHYSWLLGAFLGIPAGLLTAWLGPRRLAIITLACVVAVTIGLASGYALGAVYNAPVHPLAFLAALLCDVAALAVISRLKNGNWVQAARLNAASQACCRVPVPVFLQSAINVLLAKPFPLDGEASGLRRIASRFALPAMTLLAVIVCIPLGITLESVAWLRRVDRKSQPELRRLNVGCLTRGLCQFDTWNASREFRPSDLRKLRRFDGIRYFRLNRGDFDDDSLALLSEWPRLELLDWNSVADRRTRRTGGLHWSSAVDLIHTRVTGATFAKLPPSLTDLWLIGTPVTDESLQHLSRLSALESLYLADTHIGDAGVANLAGSSALRFLDLSGTKVTDAALASLARNNRSLASLELRSTSITGTGLANLADLPKLTILDLRDCRLLDDDAIQALARCPSLGSIGLSGTKVTPAGVTRLRAAMSWCLIEYGQDQSRRD